VEYSAAVKHKSYEQIIGHSVNPQAETINCEEYKIIKLQPLFTGFVTFQQPLLPSSGEPRHESYQLPHIRGGVVHKKVEHTRFTYMEQSDSFGNN